MRDYGLPGQVKTGNEFSCRVSILTLHLGQVSFCVRYLFCIFMWTWFGGLVIKIWFLKINFYVNTPCQWSFRFLFKCLKIKRAIYLICQNCAQNAKSQLKKLQGIPAILWSPLFRDSVSGLNLVNSSPFHYFQEKKIRKKKKIIKFFVVIIGMK